MNELAKVNQTMSSREIAGLLGKQHFHVMRDIRSMEAAYLQVFGDESRSGSVKSEPYHRGDRTQYKYIRPEDQDIFLGLTNSVDPNAFKLNEYLAGNGEKRPEYLLTKSQTLFVVSGYDAVVRAKIQQRWEYLEATRSTAKVALPSRTELALQVYEALEELDQANETIALQAPKVEFVDEVFEAPDLFTVGTVAKMIGTGQNRLFKELRARMVLKPNNEPYQTFVERGYFKTKGTKVGSPRFPKVVSQTMVTTRGLAWIRLNIVVPNH